MIKMTMEFGGPSPDYGDQVIGGRSILFSIIIRDFISIC